MSQTDRLPQPPMAVPLQAPPLLARLRAETRDAHDRIEAVPALSCLLSPSLSAGAYIQALRALHAFNACMWATLPPLLQDFWPPSGSGQGAFRPNDAGLQALAGDIAWFGARPAAKMGAVATLTDAASALGALYVVEGAALGARVIGHAVSVSLGVAPGRGGSFFCGATADAARTRWQQFCALLGWAEARLGADGGGRVVAGACDSFARLEKEFARHAARDGGLPTAARARQTLAPGHAARILN